MPQLGQSRRSDKERHRTLHAQDGRRGVDVLDFTQDSGSETNPTVGVVVFVKGCGAIVGQPGQPEITLLKGAVLTPLVVATALIVCQSGG